MYVLVTFIFSTTYQLHYIMKIDACEIARWLSHTNCVNAKLWFSYYVNRMEVFTQMLTIHFILFCIGLCSCTLLDFSILIYT